MDIVDRILRRVKVNDETGCWEWQGPKHPFGYGLMSVSKKYGSTYKSHNVSRLMYASVHGKIPEGMCCLHKCDNPSCCNPDHLFIGTLGDNNRDRKHKKRSACGNTHWTHTHSETVRRGENHAMAILTEFDVRAIRKQYTAGNITHKQLAGLYGVDRSTIGLILRRKHWTHIA